MQPLSEDLVNHIHKRKIYRKWSPLLRIQFHLFISRMCIPDNIFREDVFNLLQHRGGGIYDEEIITIVYRSRYGEPDIEKIINIIDKELFVNLSHYTFDSAYKSDADMAGKVVHFPMSYERLRLMANALIDLHTMVDKAKASREHRKGAFKDWEHLSLLIQKAVAHMKDHNRHELAEELEKARNLISVDRLAMALDQPLEDFPTEKLQDPHQELLRSLENCILSIRHGD